MRAEDRRAAEVGGGGTISVRRAKKSLQESVGSDFELDRAGVVAR